MQLFDDKDVPEGDPWHYEVGSMKEDMFELDFPSVGMTLAIHILRDPVDTSGEIVDLTAYREQKNREADED